ncbi:MAG TPA: HAMP domain-containing sensor histidine kinase, partial [Chitinophagales bacterium]|nr:HAMP domain-containing sensor histidine kinase [Chitinophagales bacterium]
CRMNLLNKIGRTYLWLSFLCLLVAVPLIFLVLDRAAKAETTEKLTLQAERIFQLLEKGQDLTPMEPVLVVEEIAKGDAVNGVQDTILTDPLEGDTELFREVVMSRPVGEKYYRVTVRQIILEPHDYLLSIGLPLLLIFLLVFFGLNLLNRRLLHSVWSPFYKNLDRMQAFSVSEEATLDLETTGINEFEKLNEVVAGLADRVREEYQTVRQFTSYAAHELRTPLAVMRSGLEEMVQHAEHDQMLSARLEKLIQETERLTRLSNALLLLTRINNQQFNRMNTLHAEKEIQRSLDRWKERHPELHIQFIQNTKEEVIWKADQELADILLDNLISNMVKHGDRRKPFSITLSAKEMSWQNIGLYNGP